MQNRDWPSWLVLKSEDRQLWPASESFLRKEAQEHADPERKLRRPHLSVGREPLALWDHDLLDSFFAVGVLLQRVRDEGRDLTIQRL